MPVLNEESDLECGVRAIFAQDYPGPMEVCIALGPSRDRTNEVVERLQRVEPRLSTVSNPSGRTPVGLNGAIRATTGEIVVRVDGHTELPPGYIRRAVETLVRTGAVNVGGIQKAIGQTVFEQAVAEAMASPFGMGGAKFHSGGDEGPVDTVFLGVFRREAIEKVGLFDETLTRNQDYELNIRLRKAGGVIWFDPTLVVSYRPRPTLSSLARQFFEYGSWKRHVLSIHPGSLKIRQIVPPLVLLAIISAIISAPWSPLSLLLPAVYALLTLGVSVRTAPRHAFRLAVIFPTMHFSWAWGFLARRTRHS